MFKQLALALVLTIGIYTPVKAEAVIPNLDTLIPKYEVSKNKESTCARCKRRRRRYYIVDCGGRRLFPYRGIRIGRRF